MEIEQSSEPHSSRPRILLVSSLFAPVVGGVCTVAEALATHLSEHIAVAAPKCRIGLIRDWQRYDQRFAFPVCRVDTFESELPRGVPGKLRGALQFACNTLWTRRRAAASILRFLTTHPVDLVCVNTLGCYWVAAMLQRRHPALKVIFYLHGEEVSCGAPMHRIDKLRNTALQAADAIVAVSSFTRDRVLHCGVDPARIHVIHNGVDAERFTPGPKDAGIEARFGLAGKQVLLCLARLDERKGQDMLLQAMPAILAAVPDAVLLLVGEGAEEKRLRTLTETLGLLPHVVFAGFAAEGEVVAYYRTADAYVMPNRQTASGDTEGFGLVFLEAGACAKPVVGGRAGGVPDAVLDGKTGYLVDGTSARDIAEVCIRLLTHPELAHQIGQNGLLHSSKNTWTCQANLFLELCNTLISRASGQPRETP